MRRRLGRKVPAVVLWGRKRPRAVGVEGVLRLLLNTNCWVGGAGSEERRSRTGSRGNLQRGAAAAGKSKGGCSRGTNKSGRGAAAAAVGIKESGTLRLLLTAARG